MRTRREFCVDLFSVGMVVAAGGVLGSVAGCGGGTPQNTAFLGSYTGPLYTFIPFSAFAAGSYLAENQILYGACSGTNSVDGYMQISVDEKGKVTGSATNPFPDANPNGVAADIQGTVDNSGNFSWEYKLNGNSYKMTGSLSDQLVTVADDPLITGIPASGDTACLEALSVATASRSTVVRTRAVSPHQAAAQVAGITGNFRITINGVQYDGTFQAAGGSTTTTT